MKMATTSLVRNGFKGGMAYDVADTVASHDALRLVNNMIPRPLGALTARDARKRRYAIDPYSSAVRALDVFRYRSSSGDYFDVATIQTGSDNRIVRVSASGWSNLATGLTAGARTISMHARDRMFMANGVDPVKAYLYASSTHTVRNVGLGNGPAATASVNTAAGNLNGTYTYKVTALYGTDGETNAGTVSSSVSPSNQKVNISWPTPTPPAGMTLTGYRIWRKLTSGTAWNTWYLVDQVAVGTNSYIDNIADTTVFAAGEGDKLHDNHNAVPNGCVGVVWWEYENRAVAWGDPANPTRLWFSDDGKPEQWRTANDSVDVENLAQYIDVPQDDRTNPVIAVVPYDRFLLVLNRYGARVVTATGSASIPYTSAEVAGSREHGILGPKAWAMTDRGEVFYLSTTGMRLVRGRVDISVDAADESGRLNMVGRPAPANVADGIAAIVQNIPTAFRAHVAGCCYRDLVHFAIAVPDEAGTAPTHNNDVLIFDTITKSVVYRQNANISAFEVINDSTGDYTLVSASAEAGMVFNEYVQGQIADDPASGPYSSMVTTDVEWRLQDFHRVLANYNTALLQKLIVNIGVKGSDATDRVIAADLNLDGGRRTVSKTVAISAGGVRFWQDSGYLQTNGVHTTIATWAAVTNGSFRITIDGTAYNCSGINFTSVTTMADVASVIQTALRAASSTQVWIA
jgi:hypothetical protein